MRQTNQSDRRLVPREFFSRSPKLVAPDLLGKVLLHRTGKQIVSGRIIETEAYLGRDDPASHAYSKETAANTVLFGLPGHAHVYLIYGLHYCLSVSAHLNGRGGGVLIRALYPLDGLALMAHRRGQEGRTDFRWLTGGPGRVCQALGITRSTHDAVDLTERASTLQILDDGYVCTDVNISKRIGISRAADEMLRFHLSRVEGD